MKNGWMIFFASVIVACGAKESETDIEGNVLEKLSFNVDTVVVDSKGVLFELQWGPRSSSISEDGKYLYLFNSRTNQIQQINLDKMVWEKDFNFEVEGPNGITDRVETTKTLGNREFLISSYQKLGIFNESGTKLHDFSISKLPLETELSELDYALILSKDRRYLFSLPGKEFEGPRTFAKINMESFEIHNIPMPEMDWIFDLQFGTDGGMKVQERMYLQEINGQILAWSPSSSAFYRYDPSADSLFYHAFVHQLTPSVNDVQLNPQTESNEEYREELRKFFMSVSFGPMIWDNSRGLYLRFGKKPLERSESLALISSEVFLYAYNPDFNLVGEAILPISIYPNSPFFKDGKVWSYVNVEDELGFAIMDFKF